MPSMMRPANSSQSEPARPVTRLPTAVPTRDRIRTGLRPNRSETRPQRGEKTSCMREKDATSRPTVTGRGPEALGVAGQEGQHDPEPDEVEGDRRPDRGEAGRQRLTLPDHRASEPEASRPVKSELLPNFVAIATSHVASATKFAGGQARRTLVPVLVSSTT